MRSTSMINKLNLTLDAIAEENSSDYNQVVDRTVGAWVEAKYFDGHKTIWYKAKIIDIDASANSAKENFYGWNPRFDA